MKLRSLVLAAVMLAGLFSAFAFKSANKPEVNGAKFIYFLSGQTYCLPDFTDQESCTFFHTGAVCTVTNAQGVFTAYEPSDAGCQRILRQP